MNQMIVKLKILYSLFQDAATPMMQGIIDLHHDIFFFLILILVFVSWILVRALWHFHYKKNPRHLNLTNLAINLAILVFVVLTSPVTVANASSSEEAGLPIMPSSPVPSISEMSENWIERTYGGQEEASSSAPQAVPQGVNEEPQPPQFEVEHYLLNDEIRREQLFNRLRLQSLVYPDLDIDNLLYYQVALEKKIERCLILDGIPSQKILNELASLRGILFSPRGTPLKVSTLARYLREMEQNGMRQGILYGRVWKAIREYELFIHR